MVWLAVLFSLVLMGAALWLLARVHGTIRAAQALLRAEGARHPDLRPLERLVRTAFDESLALALCQPNPAQLELAYREHQDPYQKVADLLSWIGRHANAEKPAVVEEIIKAICQLGLTLHLPAAALEVCLQPFANRLQRLVAPGQGEVQITYVQPGELIETSRMMPLGYGSRVQYPLGVLVLDAAGRVLSKARVLSA